MNRLIHAAGLETELDERAPGWQASHASVTNGKTVKDTGD